MLSHQMSFGTKAMLLPCRQTRLTSDFVRLPLGPVVQLLGPPAQRPSRKQICTACLTRRDNFEMDNPVWLSDFGANELKQDLVARANAPSLHLHSIFIHQGTLARTGSCITIQTGEGNRCSDIPCCAAMYGVLAPASAPRVAAFWVLTLVELISLCESSKFEHCEVMVGKSGVMSRY